jgi:hypothetical protein
VTARKFAAPLVVLAAAATVVGCMVPTRSVRPEAQAKSEIPRRACKEQDLDTFVFHQGATGFLMGGFAVRNTSASSCRLGGLPRLAIFEPDGRRVPIKVRLSDGHHTPTTPRLRALRPRELGSVFMAWADYCQRRLKAPLTYRLTFPVGPSVTAKTDSATGNCITGGHTAGTVQVTSFSEPIRGR